MGDVSPTAIDILFWLVVLVLIAATVIMVVPDGWLWVGGCAALSLLIVASKYRWRRRRERNQG